MNNKLSEILSDIGANDELLIPLKDKYIRLKQLLERNCKELTKEETLQFPSLFSRLIYIAQKYNLPKSLEWQLQNIRVKASFLLRDEQHIISERQYKNAENVLILLFRHIYEGAPIAETDTKDGLFEEISISLDKIRVELVRIDYEKELLTCKADANISDNELTVCYNVTNINDAFNKTIEKLWIGANINLIDCKINELGQYIPKFIVLEPDYLIDASSLAECFQNYGKSHLHYFRRKFEQTPNSQHILLGNLANFFLDELIYASHPQELVFEDVFLKAFKQTPFEFTSCKEIERNEDFKAFMMKARTQFQNIKRVILHDFPKSKIDIHKCTLEPSFFCEKFGFQGRLDLLQLDDETNISKIIELKSGGLPYPKDNASKIAINHETQTAIYRLIIETVFNKSKRQIASSILYSAAENMSENLRLSAPYQVLEKEIINIRNQIVALEHDLYIGEDLCVENAFAHTFNLDNYGRVPQFFIDRLSDLEQVIKNTSELERKYFYRYISFITRELYLQKMGNDGYESNSSTSALWNTEFKERLDAFDLISDLEIENIDDSGTDMKICFKRNISSDFVNFREGEICILYPKEKESDSLLSNQILKGTIVSISKTEVMVRFRYKQQNKSYFNNHRLWAIEHDKLDHAHNAMYKSLFAFLSAPQAKRDLLLGITQPHSEYTQKKADREFSAENKQKTVMEKALSAKDYFLIVGPPGTGKTSIFARRLIEQLRADGAKNILVIAYTNRAVDELCDAINSAFGCVDGLCDQYIRIGTELSCGETYRHRLLQNISKQVNTRKELKDTLINQSIYVGTLASITGKPEIFDLKKFDLAIIDEASQILEPQLMGILTQLEKFILIGDHKQLSTITLQDEQKSKVNDTELNDIGLLNCRESYFERLFRLSQTNNWEHAYDTLTYQGRMHRELASFPNTNFYNSILQEANEWQTEPLQLITGNTSNKYEEVVSTKRYAFFPNKQTNNKAVSDKINEEEADTVVAIAKAILSIYKASGIIFDAKTLGIITPYRNQIALIRHKLELCQIPELQNLMIDTVERYQGSQRDIIILSFCINRPYQLNFFCNLNTDGTVDRKLNVALTRARKQLFLVGNEYVLSQNPIYRNLLEHFKS